MTPRLLFIATTLALLTSTAEAQQKTVYRCGQAYQDSPCPDGKTIDVADERSDAERQAAIEAARNEEAFGSRLRRERLEQERQQRFAGAANVGARPRPAARVEPEHEFKPKKKREKPAKAEKPVKTTLKPSRPPKPRKPNQAAG